VCGENLYAKHSIFYEDLLSYFYGFSIWTDEDMALSWDETLEWFALFGVIPVNVLWEGRFDEDQIRNIDLRMDFEKQEGYVVRLRSAFHFDDFKWSVAKVVRPKHVRTSEFWRTELIVPNQLAK